MEHQCAVVCFMYRVIQNLTPPSREELAGPYQKLAMVHCNIFSLKKVCRILCPRTNYLLHKVHSRRRACSRFFRVFTPVLPWITRHNKRLSFFPRNAVKKAKIPFSRWLNVLFWVYEVSSTDRRRVHSRKWLKQAELGSGSKHKFERRWGEWITLLLGH